MNVPMEDINSTAVLLSDFHQGKIKKESDNSNVDEKLLLQDVVNLEDCCSKLLPFQIKLEKPDMKYELTDDCMNNKLANCVTGELIQINENDATTKIIYEDKVKEELSDPNVDNELWLENVVKQHSFNNSRIEVKSEIPNIKYECIDDSGDITIKQEELIIKDEAPETYVQKQPLYCAFCSDEFIDKYSLQQHLFTSTNDGFKCKFCDYCNYKCLYKCLLQKHINSHADRKQFSCGECNYKSLRSGDLLRHVKIHTGEKHFKCHICNYKCRRKYSLQEHIRVHTGEKPFNCNVCDYKCINKSKLKIHIMRLHTGEKPFNCNECNYKCRMKPTLKRHLMTHTGER